MNARKYPIRLAIGLLASVAKLAHAQFDYVTLNVPASWGTNTSPNGVSGTNVIGTFTDSIGNAHMFIYDSATGQYTSNSYPGVVETFGIGIDGNNIVGTIETVAGDGYSSRMFLYESNSWSTPPLPPSAILSLGYGISGNYVVGHYNINSAQVNYGFIYDITNGVFTTLMDPAAATGNYQGTIPYGISGPNVVGAYLDSSSAPHGFCYSMISGVFTNFDCPFGAKGTSAQGISNNIIVGYYLDAGSTPHGFIYNGATWATADAPGATNTYLGGVSGAFMIGTLVETNGTHRGFLTTSAAAIQSVTNVPVPAGYGGVAVNPNLNRIYLFGQDLQPIEVDGNSLSETLIGTTGDGVDVDVTNNYLWEGDLYSGLASVWNSSDAPVTSVPLADCPTGANVDAPHRRVWVAAQCGGGDDPVWALDADTFAIEAGPIGSGGIQGPTVVNPATGRFYLDPSSGPERIDPSNSYSITRTAFGPVLGANATANLLYGVTNGETLQIINGAPDPEVILTSAPLGFQVGGSVGVNPAAGRIYVGASGSNFVSVLNATNGAPLETLSLGTSITGINDVAVDALRGRVYVTAHSASSTYLFVIQDLTPPSILAEPVNTTVSTGGTATLSVVAAGYPLLYQWSLNGTNIAGATGSTLVLQGVTAADVGLYTVTISNGLGTIASQTVSLGLVDMHRYAGVTVDGPSGAQYSIQWASTLSSGSWTTITNLTLGAQPFIYIDYSSVTNSARYYRAVPLAP